MSTGVMVFHRVRLKEATFQLDFKYDSLKKHHTCTHALYTIKIALLMVDLSPRFSPKQEPFGINSLKRTSSSPEL
jgi:hypothetical protein